MRTVSFIDGFTSSSPPDVVGITQEFFEILNNKSSYFNFSGLVFNKDQYQTVKMFCEIERSSSIGSWRQAIDLVFIYNGSWSLTTGLNSGNPLVDDSYVSGELVLFAIDGASGQVSYKSGNLQGTSYNGNLKASIDRILNV